MNENNFTVIGLRALTQEDLEFIYEAILTFIKKILNEKVSKKNANDYDISIDVDNSKSILNIDIDISLLDDLQHTNNEKTIIQETIVETFKEIEKMLKEKFT